MRPPRAIARAAARKLLRQALRNQVRLRRRPLRYALIVGHMRSGSSLLVNLLNTHPDIRAQGEMHIAYKQREDLFELLYALSRARHRFWLTESVVVDKVLHDHLAVAEEVRCFEQVRLVFLLRAPQAAIASMLRTLAPAEFRDRPDAALDTYVEYYVRRLETLIRYAATQPRERSILLHYESIVANPEPAWNALAALLQVDRAGFSSTYRPLVSSVGDPSERLKAGRILPPSDSTPLEVLSPEQRSAIESVYKRCRSELERRVLRSV